MGKTFRKSGSISFFLSIPITFTLGGLLCITTSIFIQRLPILQKNFAALFICGFVGALSIVGTSSMPTFRTFIHELKHAIAVFISGNRLKDFHVDTHTGHVEYVMYSNKVRFAPFIILAPYFLPIFSAPVMLVCVAFGGYYRLAQGFVLGAALASDLILSYQEIHEHQTDLQKIQGGFLGAGIFIAGFIFFWTNVCALWVVAGPSGYKYLAHIVWNTIKQSTGN